MFCYSKISLIYLFPLKINPAIPRFISLQLQKELKHLLVLLLAFSQLCLGFCFGFFSQHCRTDNNGMFQTFSFNNCFKKWNVITLPSSPRQPWFFAAFRVTFLMPRVCFKSTTWYFEMHHVKTFFQCDIFPCGVMTFSCYVMFIHNMFIFKRKAYRGFRLP